MRFSTEHEDRIEVNGLCTFLGIIVLAVCVVSCGSHESTIRWIGGDHRFADGVSPRALVPFEFDLLNEGRAPIRLELGGVSCACIEAGCGVERLERGGTARIHVLLHAPPDGRFDGWVAVVVRDPRADAPARRLNLSVGCLVRPDHALRANPSRLVFRAGERDVRSARLDLLWQVPNESVAPAWMAEPDGLSIVGDVLVASGRPVWTRVSPVRFIGQIDVRIDTSAVADDGSSFLRIEPGSPTATTCAVVAGPSWT